MEAPGRGGRGAAPTGAPQPSPRSPALRPEPRVACAFAITPAGGDVHRSLCRNAENFPQTRVTSGAHSSTYFAATVSRVQQRPRGGARGRVRAHAPAVPMNFLRAPPPPPRRGADLLRGACVPLAPEARGRARGGGARDSPQRRLGLAPGRAQAARSCTLKAKLAAVFKWLRGSCLHSGGRWGVVPEEELSRSRPADRGRRSRRARKAVRASPHPGGRTLLWPDGRRPGAPAPPSLERRGTAPPRGPDKPGGGGRWPAPPQTASCPSEVMSGHMSRRHRGRTRTRAPPPLAPRGACP